MATELYVNPRNPLRLGGLLAATECVLERLFGTGRPFGELVLRACPSSGSSPDGYAKSRELSASELEGQWQLASSFSVVVTSVEHASVVASIDLFAEGSDRTVGSPNDGAPIPAWFAITPMRTPESTVLAIAVTIAVALTTDGVVVDDALQVGETAEQDPETLLEHLALDKHEAASDPTLALIAKTRMGTSM